MGQYDKKTTYIVYQMLTIFHAISNENRNERYAQKLKLI